jgi:hypothetical protein
MDRDGGFSLELESIEQWERVKEELARGRRLTVGLEVHGKKVRAEITGLLEYPRVSITFEKPEDFQQIIPCG